MWGGGRDAAVIGFTRTVSTADQSVSRKRTRQASASASTAEGRAGETIVRVTSSRNPKVKTLNYNVLQCVNGLQSYNVWVCFPGTENLEMPPPHLPPPSPPPSSTPSPKPLTFGFDQIKNEDKTGRQRQLAVWRRGEQDECSGDSDILGKLHGVTRAE